MIGDRQEIIVIDYGMGNIGSICNMLKYIGARAIVTSDKLLIERAKKLILPGVGHFDKAMSNIKALDLMEVINYKALEEKVPILGICLGMQLMCNSSEEGAEPGLSLIDATVNKFVISSQSNLKVPHMGWNTIKIAKESPILYGVDNDSRFYFVHSYYVKCNQDSNVLTYTTYGHDFVSAFIDENIIGVQFHPEKSHKFGINLFKNFNEKM